ncbi:MAG: hypothetical protein R2759_06390 [Bacteroidales bacterium]
MIAQPERAFLDTLYLHPGMYFDNPGTLDPGKVTALFPRIQFKSIGEKGIRNIRICLDINKHRFFLVKILKDVFGDPLLSVALGFKGGTALMFFFMACPVFQPISILTCLRRIVKLEVFRKIRKSS